MNNILETNIRFGLSLFYEYFSVFSNFKDIHFNVCFNKNDTIILRNKNYSNIMLSLLKKELTQFSNVTFFEDANFANYPPKDVYDLSVKLTKQSSANYLYKPYYTIKKDLQLPSKYVVINTKLVQKQDIFYWNFCKEHLNSVLTENNIKVLLIGEKACMKCKEYEIHESLSIYEDLINSFKNIIDLTVNETTDLYSEDIIVRNLNILNNSIFNIHIGHGGGQSVFCFLNNLITLATLKDLWFLNSFRPNYKIFVTSTLETFKSSLINFI